MTTTSVPNHSPELPQLLAFYLPQFHPIPENDQWWGQGFTEWTSVARARPHFPWHDQPQLPTDTGFYDLRLPETRQLQADLARQHGLTGFCYYHYWFAGRRLLARPFNEVLASGAPDFPFCLCWANENWSRRWDGKEEEILMPQTYSAADDQTHIRWLLKAFADRRYIKVDGKPLLLIYRASALPDVSVTAALWRAEAEKQGFPGLYLCAVQSFPAEYFDPASRGLDAAVEFRPNCADTPVTQRGALWDVLRAVKLTPQAYGNDRVYSYQKLMEYCLAHPEPAYRRFPCVIPSWDNTARRVNGGAIFRGANPTDYQRWLETVLQREVRQPRRPRFVFINAWNEWGEGNHLEPCQKWGRAYLEATARALQQFQSLIPR